MMKSTSCPKLIKAVKSANKILKRSENSKTQTVTRHLIWFGKEQHSKIKKGRVRASINVQPTAVSRSKSRGTARRGEKSAQRADHIRAKKEY